jgi:hypothetical protein
VHLEGLLAVKLRLELLLRLAQLGLAAGQLLGLLADH